MQRYNPFRCTCGKGDIILRTSCQPDTFGLQYYACPRSKPGTKNYGCGYFDWKDAFDERLMVSSSSTSEGSSGPYRSEQPRPSYSSGPYRSALESTNKALKARLRMLEARLEMERNPEDYAYHRMLAQELDASSGWVIIKDKTVDSAALFHDLYNDMENLGLE
ncbi:hypothetical protein Tco_0973077 [Tanacetum coccineum]